MSDALVIDKAKTAVLIMDYQNDIVGSLPEAVQKPLLSKAADLLQLARRASLPVIYVVVRFREGFPEISPRNKSFSAIKAAGRLLEGSAGSAIHSGVAPGTGDVVVTKRRVGAFFATDLEALLRAQGITALVLLGIATSGCVLSTARWAADMDYELVVISDGCADRDDEVHRVLMEKVFPRQATVVTAREFMDALV